MRRIAFFDFDGTITTHDSLVQFIRYAVGDCKTLLGALILSPLLVAYQLKLVPNDRAKQYVLRFFFKGMPEQRFKQVAEDFSLRRIDALLRPKAMERIAWHKKNGDKIVIVSASIECWLRPWCDQQHIELIATTMEFNNGVVTGNLASTNCYGEHKCIRVRQAYDLDDYDHIYAYGDSRGDKELLALADSKFFREFG